MTAPILPLLCFTVILVTESKWCSKLVLETSASARSAHGAGVRCAEAPSLAPRVGIAFSFTCRVHMELLNPGLRKG